MHRLIKIIRSENGQVIVLAALLMTVLLGFAALAIDVGMVAYTKGKLQNAADAAALAGAHDLPNKTAAEKTAKDYAELNGVEKVNTTVKTPYKDESNKDDPNRIEVRCSKKVTYTFARVLGSTFEEANVEARAVAVIDKEWKGEALPFINLDDDYEENPKIVAWEKTGPGDFESMWGEDADIPAEFKFFNTDEPSKCYCIVNYSDGITITKGTVAKKKDEVGYIYGQHKPVYIFSLRSDVIKSEKYGDTKKSTLKNKDVIPLADLVLLQVTFDSYDNTGKTLYLTVTDVYDFNETGVFPTDYLNATMGASKLIE